jgi:Tripeptidyl peptidase II
VQVHAPLRRTKLAPKATLDTLIVPLRPVDAVLSAQSSARDSLPRGRVMHRLELTYKLALAEGGTVTPTTPPLAAAVYDGALEGQLYAVYDGNKRRVAFGDVYPQPVTLGKGAPQNVAPNVTFGALHHSCMGALCCWATAPPLCSQLCPARRDAPRRTPCRSAVALPHACNAET